MKHYDWTNAVIDHAQRIEKHNREGGLSDAIPRLCVFLEKEPFIHDDGDAVYVDVAHVIKAIESNPGLDHEEITHIVMQAVVGRMRENHNGMAQRIIPMKEPDRRNDWFKEIRRTVEAYETKYKRTPDAGQLWAALKKRQGIEYHEKGDKLTSPEIGKELTRKQFGGRYSRYYPKK